MSKARKSDGKSHAGSNKTRRKQREYQQHIHAQLAAGKASMANGGWGDISATGLDPKPAQRAQTQASRFSA